MHSDEELLFKFKPYFINYKMSYVITIYTRNILRNSPSLLLLGYIWLHTTNELTR